MIGQDSTASTSTAESTDDAAPGHHPVLADRYEIRSVIARGGMGSVYFAWDRTLARGVAIKVIPLGETVDERMRAEREIAIASHSNHPAFVRVHDAGEVIWTDRPCRYLVMEHVDGDSLHDLLRDGPLDLRSVAEIGAQVADALAYLHGRTVLHLDVKPGNILVDETRALGYPQRALLIDFGISRSVQSSARDLNGEIVASAGYMSPEHVAGEPLGPASDVYSLGLVLLRAITGAEEYGGSRVESALERLSRDPRVPGELPAAWRGILAAMTDRDPLRRPTAHDVATELAELARAGRSRRHAKRRGLLALVAAA